LEANGWSDPSKNSRHFGLPLEIGAGTAPPLEVARRWCSCCHTHLETCHFQSVFFLTDSQLGPYPLSTTPAFLQRKSFWDIWDLSNSLSSCVTLSFQWVPGYAGLSGNEMANSFAKIGATLPFAQVPSPLVPVIAKISHTSFSWRRNLFQNSLSCQTPSVSSEELVLPRLAAVNCPNFAATVTAFSYFLT